MASFDPHIIRKDFPFLDIKVNGKALIYLDNGATAQKPQLVIDALNNYYTKQNSNIHRGVHTLSQEATTAYETCREKVQKYIGAKHKEEIIFTSGTTQSINLLATTFAKKHLSKNDAVLITALEHHSNIVPWQMVCEESGAKLKVIPINKNGELELESLDTLLTEEVKIVSVSHISNTLGTINPIEELIAKAKKVGAKIHIDGAQAVPHQKVDMTKLNCDFYSFSAHKMFGPTGFGVLYGKKELLEELPPYQGGGDMIKTVSFEGTTYNELPHKLEAGTPNIAAGIAFSTAIDYLAQLDWEAVKHYENELLLYTEQQLNNIKGVSIIGNAKNKASVISFTVEGAHPFDLGVILDKQGIAVRTGHHCTQPIMAFYNIPGTVRVSLAFYNTKEEVDAFIKATIRAINMLL